jgi:hypothetical protein
MLEGWNDPGACPKCGAPVDVYADCPGYRRGTQIMVCSPPCGNAWEYTCTNEACTWWYREPNGARRDVVEMGIRPTWMDRPIGAAEEGDEWISLPPS